MSASPNGSGIASGALDASVWLSQPLSSFVSRGTAGERSAADLLLPPKTLAFARRNNLFTLGQIMLLSRTQVADMLKIPIYEVDGWRRDVIEMAYRAKGTQGAAHHVGARSLGTQKRQRGEVAQASSKGKSRARNDVDWVCLGDKLLDEAIGGRGLRKGMLTDVVGESSSGKSQLVMQMAVHAALGLDHDDDDEDEEAWGFNRARASSVAFLLSEGDIQSLNFSGRMVEMARATLARRWNERLRRTGLVVKTEQDAGALAAYLDEATALLLSNLHIAKVVDMDALEHAVMYTLPGLAARLEQPPASASTSRPAAPPLGLVIVDNIASIYHPVEAGTSFQALIERSRHSALLANELRRIATTCSGGAGCAVVVVNHVQDCFERENEAARRIVAQQQLGKRAKSGDRTRGRPTSSSSAASPAPLPPLTYAAQSPFFTGHLATMLSAAVPHDADQRVSLALLPTHRYKQAALSNTWNNCINARLVLCRSHVTLDDEGGGGGESRAIGVSMAGEEGMKDEKSKLGGGDIVALRTLHLIFSPWCPPRSAQFLVTQAGCQGWSGSDWTFMPHEHAHHDEEKEEQEEEERLYADGGKRNRDDFERALAGLDEVGLRSASGSQAYRE
ncbi:hypothetical protein BDZ90DRAFT_259389 [Jaminaea rosea]|uniref:Uncharacterized protein n=1 Tax=Jaminaea rosea TaxID=1569628 RepID=A0A316UST6_9BASI|nr:hypothetical protein BDZ90DRAFT_259389 [Jaminaea rosea]PWN28340.1 hypothetical protein BDZ90DRAFT_259389 [Jaminaea rosea]